jgi:hypothetical protein
MSTQASTTSISQVRLSWKKDFAQEAARKVPKSLSAAKDKAESHAYSALKSSFMRPKLSVTNTECSACPRMKGTEKF